MKIADLIRLAAKAAAPPWEAAGPATKREPCGYGNVNGTEVSLCASIQKGDYDIAFFTGANHARDAAADAQFVAALVNAWPKLVELVEASRGVRTAWIGTEDITSTEEQRFLDALEALT